LQSLDAAFGLSGDNSVAQVAWAYPDPQGTASVVEQEDNFMRFLRTGGFIYLNSASDVVAIKSLAPMQGGLQDPESQFTLSFDQANEITQDQVSEACPGGMNPITLGNLYDAGARQYCWAFQHKLSFCEHGCFLYQLMDGYVGFALVDAEMVARTDAGSPMGCSDHCFELEPLELFESEVVLSHFSMENNNTEWSLVVGDLTYSARLSPWQDTTLQSLDAAFGLSGDNSVAQVAWAYPDPQGTASVVEQEDNFMRFLRTGGFIYLNSASDVVAIKSLAPMQGGLQDPESQFTLSFDQANEITQDQVSEACPGGMNPITLGNLYDAGARQYCWAFQHKLSFCEHGCFLYQLMDGYVGFALVDAEMVARTDAGSPTACSDHCFELEPLELFESEVVLSNFSIDTNGVEWSLILNNQTFSSRLTPWHSVTLEALDIAYGLSGNNVVAQVAWAYPDPQGTASVVEQEDNFMRFLRTGGFVYLNSAGEVVAIKSLAPMVGDERDPEAQFILSFEQSVEITQDEVSQACPSGMNPITLGNLYDAGARQYCWAFQDSLSICDHGCFLYQFAVGYVGFAVMGGGLQ